MIDVLFHFVFTANFDNKYKYFDSEKKDYVEME